MARQTDLGFDSPIPLHGERGEDILVCGKHFSTDPSGALYWPEQNTLIVSDLYLEKAHLLRYGLTDAPFRVSKLYHQTIPVGIFRRPGPNAREGLGK